MDFVVYYTGEVQVFDRKTKFKGAGGKDFIIVSITEDCDFRKLESDFTPEEIVEIKEKMVAFFQE